MSEQTILQKRDLLERFIREQTLGPGVNGYRFLDTQQSELLSADLLQQAPILYEDEIIDIVPAAVYSTGVLFPKDESGTSVDGSTIDNNEVNEDEEEEVEGQVNSFDDVENSDAVELDQMFPKTMGFTCCLDEKVLQEGRIEIKLRTRYYRKIRKDKAGEFNTRYGLLCEANVESTERFLKENELNAFRLTKIGKNVVLTLSRQVNDELTQLRRKIKNIQEQQAKEIYKQVNAIHPLSKLSLVNCRLSSLKSTLFYELKWNVTDDERRKKLYHFTQEIELIENITDHLRNLMDANDKGYGLWRSELVERRIVIENIHFEHPKKKIAYFYNKPINAPEHITVLDKDGEVLSQGLEDVFSYVIQEGIVPATGVQQSHPSVPDGKSGTKEEKASLSLNIQLSRDTRKEQGHIFLKVQLINTSTPYNNEENKSRYYSTFNEVVNQRAFFGVNLSFTNPYLTPYNQSVWNFGANGEYDEDTTTRFIYQQFKDHGVGHGCSVSWDEATKTLSTEYIPQCETPDVEPIPRNKTAPVIADRTGEYKDPSFLQTTRAQEFKWLSTLSGAADTEILQELNAFVDAYGEWIEIKRQKYQGDISLSGIALQELEKCSKDYQRMKDNISLLLANNKNNMHSFRLMNTAMFMQLWHSVKGKKGKLMELIQHEDFRGFDQTFYKQADDRLFDQIHSASWRAFQLAFILLNLDGIFQRSDDAAWERRNEYVDLVWFPTGGGKTEAYLGLIALTIINRRTLYGEQGGGTAAIMRYTLRLLTMQQFQRATLLIMALELIRRWDTQQLGKEPIYIGFWVGNNSIPNKLVDTGVDPNKRDSLLAEFDKLRKGVENKVPFDKCPWCGSLLAPAIKEDKDGDVYHKGRLHLYCDHKECSFSEPDYFEGDDSKGAIPVNLCDESIYQHPPTLLFGTVDKFAQLAHKVNNKDKGRNADSRRLFGRGNWESGKPKDGYLPPDLIIQDELHLLLGPLGSAVALFECAVDQLCLRKDGTRPKVISSTATTRNTDLQITALFDRKVDLFPKPGVECDDSFFAFYKRAYQGTDRVGATYISKRKYLGILPTGRTQIWMQMRLAAIMLTHRALFELQQLKDKDCIDHDAYFSFNKVMDYYHTVISYFNSLKEVGKTQSQVQSYILKEMRRVFARVVRPQKLMHALYTYGPLEEGELTGRLSGEEVKNELKRVEEKWDALKRFASASQAPGADPVVRGKVPPEFVVATNMISVGIDVSRFNTILMNSMSRNTAEYIQASSRVARDSYGLVTTVYHPFRARDVSHYERFVEFHRKMYSYVEPISITPFTQKAVERYMGLYLATMLRHKCGCDFYNRDSAGNILRLKKTQMDELIERLTMHFGERKERLNVSVPTIRALLKDTDLRYIHQWVEEAIEEWRKCAIKTKALNQHLVFNNKVTRAKIPQEQLYVDINAYEGSYDSLKWQIPMSLRVIEPEAAIKIYSK